MTMDTKACPTEIPPLNFKAPRKKAKNPAGREKKFYPAGINPQAGLN